MVITHSGVMNHPSIGDFATVYPGSFLVIGIQVIECSMGSLYRRCDILGLKKLFLDRLIRSDAQWIAMPSLDYSRMIKEGDFDQTTFPVRAN